VRVFAIICNEDWHIIWVSREFTELTGYSADEFFVVLENIEEPHGNSARPRHVACYFTAVSI